MIATREGIAALPGLRGKEFGIGQAGTLDDTLSRTVLRQLGVDPGDLNMVSVGQPQLRLKALKAGKIDATRTGLDDFTGQDRPCICCCRTTISSAPRR